VTLRHPGAWEVAVTDQRAQIHVCISCRANQPLVAGERVLGQQLYDGMQATMNGEVTLRPIVCLGNCAQGCSAAVSQPGKWSYLLGHLRPDQAADLAAYAQAYAASADGTVWRSGRAESLRDAIVARIPGFGFIQKETA
jgi:predicted metal-binding protein